MKCTHTNLSTQGLSSDPERYCMQVPSRVSDRPVVWDIVHDAAITPHVAAWLERRLGGMYFMCHANIPESIVEEDDAEMLFHMQGMSLHPGTAIRASMSDDEIDVEDVENMEDFDTSEGGAADCRASSGQHAETVAKQQRESLTKASASGCGGKAGGSGRAESKGGGGEEGKGGFSAQTSPRGGTVKDTKDSVVVGSTSALLGVDIDAITRSFGVSVDNILEDDELWCPNDLSLFVKPLRNRLRYFGQISEEVQDALIRDYLTAYKRSLLGCDLGYDSVDGMSADEGDAPQSASYTHTDTHELDAYYSNAPVKIVDLGNSCWTYKHFTDDIQTRQYRAPEVIVGMEYHTSADMWSFACCIFELLTGDLLFDPQAGKSWDREEDHLALMIELLGPFPRHMCSAGKESDRYFTKRGELRHIHQLKFWGLRDVLREKYKFSEADGNDIASFLIPMLEMDPRMRATAKDCLAHPWISPSPNPTGRGLGQGQGQGQGKRAFLTEAEASEASEKKRAADT